VRSFCTQTLENALDSSFPKKTRNEPELGHSGATVWWCTVTRRVEEKYAGNTTTGAPEASLSVPAGFAAAANGRSKAAATARPTKTASRVLIPLPVDRATLLVVPRRDKPDNRVPQAAN
jgi:hypothetical protein